MSLADAVDRLHQCINRLSTKRKLDDYGPTDDDVDLFSVRMRKDEPNAVNSSTNPIEDQLENQSMIQPRVSDAQSVPSSSSPLTLQFFVRTISESKTLVLRANSYDTVESVHELIQSVTGIPASQQRLIYGGKQLQWENSLADCSIERDSELQLVGRMRSTVRRQAWQCVDELVSEICGLCKGEVEEDSHSSNYVDSSLTEFLAMTPKTVEQASDHLQVFMSCFVPEALVALYASPVKGNKECAEESIRNFISSSRRDFHECIRPLFAPILIEFCKLLRRVALNDPLYSLCRSSLGLAAECFLFQRPKNGDSDKGMILVRDIFPFVCDIATKLCQDLVSSVESPISVVPSLSDVRDFTAFLLPLRAAIKSQVGLSIPMRMPLPVFGHNPPYYGEEIRFLHVIFNYLLVKMDECLQKMEAILSSKEKSEDELFHIGWCQYLAILKELHSTFKLYQGAEDKFWTVLKVRKFALCYLITKYAKRGDDHEWLLQHKNVMDFESRRHLAMMMLPDLNDDYEELHEMLIDRSQLLRESFEYIAHADPECLRAGLFMEFKNEEATGPGVVREWFCLVSKEIFDPQNALFVACPNDRRRFYPNPASNVNPLHLEYFNFSGRVIALALMHKVQVGVVFDRLFFLQLAGKRISLEDICNADPYLYSSCKQILEMDAEVVDSDALGLTFVLEVEDLGSKKVVELSDGGKSIAVTSRNRKMYVDLLVERRFVMSIKEQIRHFGQGFTDIMCDPTHLKFFQSLELEDLDWMLHGSESAISVEDWKAHTDYNGYKETDPQIFWFWKSIEEMSAEQRKVLLFFWTSIKYLPIEGFRGLASRLYIYKSNEPCDRLPSSHTCFFQLCLPSYPSMGVMQDRLRIITREDVGSSFGTW